MNDFNDYRSFFKNHQSLFRILFPDNTFSFLCWYFSQSHIDFPSDERFVEYKADLSSKEWNQLFQCVCACKKEIEWRKRILEKATDPNKSLALIGIRSRLLNHLIKKELISLDEINDENQVISKLPPSMRRKLPHVRKAAEAGPIITSHFDHL